MTNPSSDPAPASATAPRFDPSRGDKPVRSITANVTIEADSWADFRRELVCMIDDIDRNGRVRNVISGGYGSGRSVNSTFNPHITHEVWSRNLDAYIDYAEARCTSTVPSLADALGEALNLLEHYAEFIRTDVKADDFERHPYLPRIDQAIEDLRATLTKHGAEG